MGAVKRLLLDAQECDRGASALLAAMQAHAQHGAPAPRDDAGRLICPDCLGTGEGEPYALTTAYSDEPPEWLTEPCLLCRGTGRLPDREPRPPRPYREPSFEDLDETDLPF